MTFYPTRKQMTVDTYRERCFGNEVWQFIDDLVNGRLVMLFLPGSLPVGAVGFLIVIPGVAIVISLLFTVFKNETPAFSGTFMVAGSFLLVIIHGIFYAASSSWLPLRPA